MICFHSINPNRNKLYISICRGLHRAGIEPHDRLCQLSWAWLAELLWQHLVWGTTYTTVSVAAWKKHFGCEYFPLVSPHCSVLRSSGLTTLTGEWRSSARHWSCRLCSCPARLLTMRELFVWSFLAFDRLWSQQLQWWFLHLLNCTVYKMPFHIQLHSYTIHSDTIFYHRFLWNSMTAFVLHWSKEEFAPIKQHLNLWMWNFNRWRKRR